MIENLPNNSNSYKERQQEEVAEEKKVTKVVSGEVVAKKKSVVHKFTDDLNSVAGYVIKDILIPSAKDLVVDIVRDGIAMLVYHDDRPSRGSRRSDSKVSYRNYYDDKRERDRYGSREDSRDRFDYDELIFRSRGDAESVLDEMQNILDKYKVVTVADMYDLADRTAPYTSNRYGWLSIRRAEVLRVRDGYVIKLPKASVIE